MIESCNLVLFRSILLFIHIQENPKTNREKRGYVWVPPLPKNKISRLRWLGLLLQAPGQQRWLVVNHDFTLRSQAQVYCAIAQWQLEAIARSEGDEADINIEEITTRTLLLVKIHPRLSLTTIKLLKTLSGTKNQNLPQTAAHVHEDNTCKFFLCLMS